MEFSKVDEQSLLSPPHKYYLLSPTLPKNDHPFTGGREWGMKRAGQGEGSIPYHLQCCAREPFSVCNRKTGTSGLLCCQVTVKMNGWAPGPTWYWTSLIYRTLQPWLLHLRVGLSGKIPKHIPLSVYDFMMSKI